MSKSESNRLTRLEMQALCQACGNFTSAGMEDVSLDERSPFDRAIWDAVVTAHRKLSRRVEAMGGFRESDGRLDPPDDDEDEDGDDD